MTKEIVEAIHALEREKGIAAERLMLGLEDALLSAYMKTPGAAKYAKVELDRETCDFRVWELLVPVELEAKLVDEVIEEETTIDPETGERREPEEPRLNLERLAEYEDQIETRDVTPSNFGRIAAQTAKQVILQRIREAERDMMYEEYRDRVGELVTGIIQQSDSRYTLVQLRERVEALLPRSEQVDGERYDHGMRVKAVITEVSASTKGPSIIVSRRSPELIKKLFALEVPEVADGLVDITNVAREPGYRSKIAVVSHTSGVDPVGACVGPRGSRVRMVVSELRGEKIDIIPHNDEPARFVAKALSPARVREVVVDDGNKQATVVVPDDQLSLAIGKEGQNARLAARLTGWRIDIRSETEFAREEVELGLGDEEQATGRCRAVLSTGKRCPNAALGGSSYCGLPAHQELEREAAEAAAEAGETGEPEAEADEREAPEPDAASVEPEAPEPADEPEAAEVEVAEPEAAEVAVVEPDAAEPDAAEPEAAEVAVVEPEAPEPADEPEAAEAGLAEPEAAEAASVEPEAAEAGLAEPEAADPEATEAALVEPQAEAADADAAGEPVEEPTSGAEPDPDAGPAPVGAEREDAPADPDEMISNRGLRPGSE